MSTALVRFDGPDGWSGMREVFSAATREESLAVIALNSGVYAGKPGELGKHLRVQPTEEPDAKAVAISFVDSDPKAAQKVVMQVMGALIENSKRSDSGVKVEVLDPATLPADPIFPDPLEEAAAGISVGFACAIAMGIWRYFKGSYPWDAGAKSSLFTKGLDDRGLIGKGCSRGDCTGYSRLRA